MPHLLLRHDPAEAEELRRLLRGRIGRFGTVLRGCRNGERDLRSRHNLAYWHGRDYVGIGVGAVSTIDGRRWRNTPRLASYVQSGMLLRPCSISAAVGA